MMILITLKNNIDKLVSNQRELIDIDKLPEKAKTRYKYVTCDSTFLLEEYLQRKVRRKVTSISFKSRGVLPYDLEGSTERKRDFHPPGQEIRESVLGIQD